MKVIHLISGGDTGGAKTHVLSLLHDLSEHAEVTLICFRRGPFSEEAEGLGIHTRVLDGGLPRTVRKLVSVIKEEGYELVHCHGSKANLTGAVLKLFVKAPVISTVHSDYRLDYLGRPMARLTYGKLNALSLRMLDYRIAVSGSMKDLLIERGFRPNKVFTIYNGLDFNRKPEPRNRDAFHKRIGLETDADSVVVGIGARLDPVKDVATLIRGFAIAYRENGALRLIIAGKGQEREALEKLARDEGVGDAVRFAGHLTDMDEFYGAIDINTLASLSETFPYALTEGALFRLPTVSSRTGGVPALITQGETGFMFEPGDYVELSKCLLKLSLDKELRDRLGRALYAKASAEFSREATCERQMEIYGTVLRRAALPKGSRSGVVICGAYGFGNAGDDAILEAIIMEMRAIDPEMPLTVLTRSVRETRLTYGIDALHSVNVTGQLRAMKRAKLYINGGGSLIQDNTSRRSLWYYLASIAAAKNCGCKVIMYGCGIGPVRRGYNIRLARRVLDSKVDVITLREDMSLSELERFGVTRPEIILASDPALTLPAADGGRVDSEMERLGLDPGGAYICFALRRWQGFNTHKAAIFAKAADYAYEKYGLTPVFIAINHKSDGEAAQSVAALISAPYHIIREPMDSGLTIGILSRMSVLVSMRLHGLIFTARHGVPMIGVEYDPKVGAFLRCIGHDLYINYDKLDAETLCADIDTAVSERGDAADTAARTRRLLELESRNVEAARRLIES